MKSNYLSNHLTRIVAIAVLCLSFSCSKDKGPEPKVDEEKKDPIEIAEVTINKDKVLPGEALMLTFNGTNDLKDTLQVDLAGKMMILFKTESNQYTGVIPVLKSGNYTIKLSNKLKNNLSLTILPYTTIENPEGVIADFKAEINASVEHLKTLSPTSIANISLLENMMAELAELTNKLTASEQADLAYFIKSNKLEIQLFKPNTQGKAAGRMVLMAKNAGDNLVNTGLKMKNGVIVAAAAIPVAVYSLIGIYKAPVPLKHYFALASVVSISTYIIALEYAGLQAAEVGKFSDIAVEIITSEGANRFGRTMSVNEQSPKIVYKNGKTQGLPIQIRLNTISNQLVNHPSTFVKQVFADNSTLIKIDKQFASHVNGLLEYLPKIGTYTSFSSKMANTSESVVQEGQIEYFSAANVSDPSITLTYTKENGVFMLKLTSDRILTVKDISFDLIYRNEDLDITLKKTINAVFDGGRHPDKMEIFAGNNQISEFGKALGKALEVKVIDDAGKALSGVEVKWSVKSGGGTLANSTSVSDANGIAKNNWTLGASGTQEVSASVTRTDGAAVKGSPLIFVATTSGLAGKWLVKERYLTLNSEGILTQGTGEYFLFDSKGTYSYFYKPRPGGGFDEEIRGTYTLDLSKQELYLKPTGATATETWAIRSMTTIDMVIETPSPYTDDKGDVYTDKYTLKKAN
ncbi:Ig-like domain-containing protein [Pedobacter sp. ASV1-7]|uniref:Ig-like domain-containing protein n=1 Tax=Pedobacter sp. ASV1-7 TaxID=3145237 RepID=UPI0032E920AD